MKFVDPDGLNIALVNFRKWAYGFGHSSIFAQDENGNWVAGDFGGRRNQPGGIEFLLESWNGKAEGGRFWVTNTGTSDLNEAIAIVAARLGNDDEYLAFEFESSSAGDLNVISEMKKEAIKYPINDVPVEGVEPYKLVGNSCLDSSFNLFAKGDVEFGVTDFNVPGVIPNNVYDRLESVLQYYPDYVKIHRSMDEE